MIVLFFDLETTGKSVTKDRIVQISAIKTEYVSGTNEFNIITKKKLLINPEIPIDSEATKVHGISNEMVKNLAPFSKYSKEIFEVFNDTDYLAGYNIGTFDVPLLCEEFNRCDLSWTPKQIIDSYTIFRDREKRDLTAALKFYCGQQMVGAHDAEFDVLATISVLEGQMFRYNIDLQECLLKQDTLDIAGKLIMKEGVPCYNFGKAAGTPILEDRGFGIWMIKNDFPSNTKNILKSILYETRND